MAETDIKKLPLIFGLKSVYNQKYVRYVNEDGENHGFLKASGENLNELNTKFFVDKATNRQPSNRQTPNVHIRSQYNIKYWIPASQDDWTIVVKAEERNEDTLFKLKVVNCAPLTVQILHIQHNNYVRVLDNDILSLDDADVKDELLPNFNFEVIEVEGRIQ